MQDTTFGNILAALALAAVFLFLFTTPAHGQKQTIVFVITPDCEHEITQIDLYIGKRFDAVCMFGVDIATLENVTVPALRAIYPSEPLMFLADGEQFDEYTNLKDGVTVENAGGRADIWNGYAVVKLNYGHLYQFAVHELLHLQTCAVHHNGPMEPVENWERIAVRPWC